jgi:hypothetical protein
MVVGFGWLVLVGFGWLVLVGWFWLVGFGWLVLVLVLVGQFVVLVCSCVFDSDCCLLTVDC